MEDDEKADWRTKPRASGSQLEIGQVVARLREYVPDEFEDKAWEKTGKKLRTAISLFFE